MSAWFPRWVRRVVDPNFYEAGVHRACVDVLTRKALKEHSICHYIIHTTTQSCAIKIVTFTPTACWALAPSGHLSPENHQCRHLPTVPTLTQTRGSRCPQWLFLGEGAGAWGGQMSSHNCCLGIFICREKINCPAWQLNCVCIDTAMDSNLKGLQLPPTIIAECEAQDTSRGSRALGHSSQIQ